MRIALFTETFLPKIDGITTRLRYTIEHLQRNGNQILVIAPDGGISEYKGAKVYGVSGFPLPLYPELKIALPRPAIASVLKEFQPDIIHVVNPAVLGLSGIFYSKRLNIPLVASYHTHLPQYLQHYGLQSLEGLLWELLKNAHNQAALNLCTSTAMIKELTAHGIKRLYLWQKGVDTELFHPQMASVSMRSHLSQNHPESPLLLYVGRLSAEKEIEGIKAILEAIPEARLALVGDGPHRQILKKHFHGTNTNFVGYLTGNELASAFASADAFIFPSRTETLGLVLLEAMAAGCPVVAARSGGIPDIVTNGVNGYLFEAKVDLQEAIAATINLLQNKQKSNIIRQNARREAEKWGWETAVYQLQNYYQKAIFAQNNIWKKI
ncbi:glycosyltransferase family 1 protein [Calothrix sp. PCC 7507]|uniref:glycosyltransferase family 4 protein n=1 Tax=Calothrix sp. PCC 7507 TaxID=99598 RepID=UPI0005AB1496|nr:glycosyltransferase family 1 protein [Calothrix sp. PCC 7507]